MVVNSSGWGVSMYGWAGQVVSMGGWSGKVAGDLGLVFVLRRIAPSGWCVSMGGWSDKVAGDFGLVFVLRRVVPMSCFGVRVGEVAGHLGLVFILWRVAPMPCFGVRVGNVPSISCSVLLLFSGVLSVSWSATVMSFRNLIIVGFGLGRLESFKVFFWKVKGVSRVGENPSICSMQ